MQIVLGNGAGRDGRDGRDGREGKKGDKVFTSLINKIIITTDASSNDAL